MTRLAPLLAAFLLAVPLAAAHPPATVTNSGTLVADAFAGCVPTNCDVLFLKVDALLPHFLSHQVSAVHSGGTGPAYNFYLRYFNTVGGTWDPIPGCPDVFMPTSFGTTQTCILPPQPFATAVRGTFEALRPHQVGTVSFTHDLTG